MIETVLWLAFKNNQPEGICDDITLNWHLKVYSEIPNVDVTINNKFVLILRETDGQSILFERLSENA